MFYGITGNTTKEKLWAPAAELTRWMLEHDVPFCLHEAVADGLARRGLLDGALCAQHSEQDLAAKVDVLLSFGGDGTLLRSAHEVGTRGTPILGVNIGRLGFLADIEVGQLPHAIEQLEAGSYRIEERLALEAEIERPGETTTRWALNEFAVERSGAAGLITVEVQVDGVRLNDYWADGLLVATPTGSTAYSLSVGGPIIMPGSAVMLLAPIAPHSLTARPIVLPAASVVEARVVTSAQPYILAADGESMTFNDGAETRLTFRRAGHSVHLVKLTGQHYFQTLRSKLMWGVRGF